jgi:PAS domain S-box-containing protein
MLEFWRFKSIDTDRFQIIEGHHQLLLVAISIGIAAIAAYSALTVQERIQGSNSRETRNNWLALGTFVLGIGVWAMHFTGMLAFRVPVAMEYKPIITLVSSIFAFPGIYIAMRVLASHHRPSVLQIQGGALAAALSIGCMHYVGMEAMNMAAELTYDPVLFVLSIVIADILAMIAMYVRITYRTNEKSTFLSRALTALLIGAAISGMHYSAMAAATFSTPIGVSFPMQDHSGIDLIMSIAISCVVAILAGITVVATIFDRHTETDHTNEIRRQATLDAIADGILFLNEHGLIMQSNNAASQIFGRSKEELSNQPIDLLMPSVDYISLAVAISSNGVATKNRYIEFCGEKSNGDRCSAEVSCSNISENEPPIYTCMVRDITERQALEEQLQQAQKLESIGQLAAGIAHEINTPTQYILDNTSFLKKVFGKILPVLESCEELANTEAPAELDLKRKEMAQTLKKLKLSFLSKEIPKALDQSIDGLYRVSNIVSAMKSFSHPSKGEKQATNLQESIQTTVTVARSEWRYYADVEVKAEDNLPLVSCLRDEINQVILNLIVNSVHAIRDTLEPGVRDKGKITIHLSHNNGHIQIKLSDDGAGMPEDIMKKIFDPFFTTKEIGKGTGQGLSIAYSVIVVTHGGNISVASQPSKGTTFTITLPIHGSITTIEEEAGTPV